MADTDQTYLPFGSEQFQVAAAFSPTGRALRTNVLRAFALFFFFRIRIVTVALDAERSETRRVSFALPPRRTVTSFSALATGATESTRTVFDLTREMWRSR